MTATSERLRYRHILHDGDPAAIRALAETLTSLSAERRAIPAQLAETTLDGTSTYRWLLAEAGKELVGFACYDRAELSTTSFELYWIAVLPRLQKQGLGRELIGRVARLARAKHGLQLFAETSSRDTHAAARAFYERLGFTEVARLADFYAPGDDRLVLRLALDGAGVSAAGDAGS